MEPAATDIWAEEERRERAELHKRLTNVLEALHRLELEVEAIAVDLDDAPLREDQSGV